MRHDQLWFLNTLVNVRVAQADGNDGLSVLEHSAPHGDSPPLHVHRTEDEVFHVIQGRLRFRVADQQCECGPGEVVLAPKGVPHTYRIESPEGGKFLTVTRHGDFEQFVRAMGRPAERNELPTPSGPPTPAAIEALTTAAGRFGIEFVGPPLE